MKHRQHEKILEEFKKDLEKRKQNIRYEERSALKEKLFAKGIASS